MVRCCVLCVVVSGRRVEVVAALVHLLLLVIGLRFLGLLAVFI